MFSFFLISLLATTTTFAAPTSRNDREIFIAEDFSKEAQIGQTSKAFYYHQNGRAGACGNYSVDSDTVVGLPLEFYKNTKKISKFCGSYIMITNPLNNITVSAQVQDASGGNNSLTLSIATYESLAGNRDDMDLLNWVFANSTQLNIILAAKKDSPEPSAISEYTPTSSYEEPSKTSTHSTTSSTTSTYTPSSTIAESTSTSTYSESSTSYSKPSPTSTYSKTSTSSAEEPTSSSSSTYSESSSEIYSSTSSYSAPSSTSTYSATTTSLMPTATSSGTEPFVGKATYYTQQGGTGSCGRTYEDSAMIVAIDVGMYDAKKCFDTLTITRTSTGKSITAIMADKCPGCKSTQSLDLSVAAFDALGSEGEGVFDITWGWN